jgi:hypothetical protein
MLRMRLIWRTLCLVLLLPFFAHGIAAATELTKDDIDFRKEVFVSATKERLPYRLFVPTGYDARRKYPLMVWLHGSEGRGSDNIKQITRGNQLGSHFWISSDAQLKFPMFVLLLSVPPSKTGPSRNSTSPANGCCWQWTRWLKWKRSFQLTRIVFISPANPWAVSACGRFYRRSRESGPAP